MTSHRGSRTATGLKVGIVVSRWNELVTEELLRGCLDELESLGQPEVTLVRVAGSWEIPLAAKTLLETRGVEGVVALGCILQGATGHAGMLAGDVASTLMSLQMSTGVPISWGVLTPETQEQALERTGMKVGHKGREAASALVEQITLLRQLKNADTA
jgi:6,7-dimethyl-8-ribityllumazine synthase